MQVHVHVQQAIGLSGLEGRGEERTTPPSGSHETVKEMEPLGAG